jgi:hypothetical protein|tara:strand:- start:2064 stop:2468 length:405 start_codon:yes stop_codon:yes gene_type:complete
MGKVGTFWHRLSAANDVATVGTGFLLAKRHDLTLEETRIAGTIETVRVKVKAIAGGATTMTLKLCQNSNGTQIIDEQTVTMKLDVGSAVAGSAIFDLDIAHVNTVLPLPTTISCFYKVDAGTVTVDSVDLIWSE